jgi:hypothetical protein
VCELATGLKVIVVKVHNSQINPVTNPKPMLSQLSHDTGVRSEKNSLNYPRVVSSGSTILAFSLHVTIYCNMITNSTSFCRYWTYMRETVDSIAGRTAA